MVIRHNHTEFCSNCNQCYFYCRTPSPVSHFEVLYLSEFPLVSTIMLLIPNTNAFTVEIMEMTMPLITTCPVLFAVFWPIFFNKRGQ